MLDPSIDHALSAGPVPPRPPVRGRVPFALAVATALAVHAGALFVALALQPHLLGADGARVDGIEVTLVQGAAQDSVATPVVQAPAASLTAVAVTDGDGPVAIDAAATASTPPIEPLKAELPPIDKAAGDIVTAALPPLRLPTEPPLIEVRPPATGMPIAATEGGAASRADAVAPTIEAAAGAPPGVADAFKLAVRQALRKSRPPYGRGRGGEASIVFTIGQFGSVEAVHVHASSGDPAQDQMAIAAVRATRFPIPDQRLTPAQRTWPITYRFGGRR